MKGGVGEIADIQRYSSDNVFEGKIDTDNVHKYFLYAYKNNERNLSFLEKLKMKISLSSPNYNLYRFQKVEVNLFKVNDIANQDDVKDDSKTGTSQEERTLNQRLSGEWLIIAITYNYGEGDGFSQEITLVKRELGFNDNDYNKDKSY
jgi:hypothetical protein